MQHTFRCGDVVRVGAGLQGVLDPIVRHLKLLPCGTLHGFIAALKRMALLHYWQSSVCGTYPFPMDPIAGSSNFCHGGSLWLYYCKICANFTVKIAFHMDIIAGD